MSVIWYEEDARRDVADLDPDELTDFPWAAALADLALTDRARPEPVAAPLLPPYPADPWPSLSRESSPLALSPVPEPSPRRWPWDFPWDAVACAASLVLGIALTLIWGWIEFLL